MKIGNGFRRKLQFGSVSVGVTAAVIAAVLLINILVSALCSHNRWFLDMTTEPLYTLTEDGKSLMASTIESANATRPADQPVKVDIIFCADPDMLYGNNMMRYVYYTALAFEKEFPNTIEVKTEDVWENPSAVDAYRNNSYSSIYQSNIIVSSGTEFRVYSYKAFYAYNAEGDEEPWAYEGEKNFIKGIMAVTRAEAPICAITTNHGEPFDHDTGETEYTEFLKVIENSGYDIVFLDLEKEAIPENCRLVITFDPQKDFDLNYDFREGGVSEVSKLEKHLNNTYSYMVFVDADTPKLTNLEEFLEEWGIAFDRYEKNATFEVIDAASSLDGNGQTIVAQYESEGLGGSLTEDMREAGGSPKVVFGNAMSISYSHSYRTSYILADEEAGTGAFTYGNYYSNDWLRDIFDVFSSTDTAYAYAKENGVRLTDENGKDLVVDTKGEYRLMTVTQHHRTVGEGQGYTNVYPDSYVCAVGSTEFASNAVLQSNAYGNTDALLGAMRMIGHEIVPVGLKLIPLYESEMDTEYYSEESATVWTVFMVVLPAIILTGAGIYILVRRKVRS